MKFPLWDRVKQAFKPKAAITESSQLLKLLQSGWSSRAGMDITPEDAMGVAAVSSAMGILSESIAQLPLNVYRRIERGKERADKHPLWRVLHIQPNSFQDSFQFRELMQLHLLGYGNCFAFKNFVRGELRELLPIHPSRVQIEQDERMRVIYTITLPDGSQLDFGRDRIFHIKDRGLDAVIGMSRVQTGRDSIGLALGQEQHAAQLFGNGARPSGILSTDRPLKAEQMAAIRESWTAAHGGDNAMGTAVLDNGFSWSALTMTSTDAQFIENRKLQIAEVSRIFRVPPHMLGDLDRATFSNIEQQNIEFLVYSLMSWLKRWESAINTQLLMPNERDEYFAEFVVEGFLRGDTKTRYEAYEIALRDGWLNRNQVREKENLNADIPDGDEYRMAENIFGQEDQEPAPDNTDAIENRVNTLMDAKLAPVLQKLEGISARQISQKPAKPQPAPNVNVEVPETNVTVQLELPEQKKIKKTVSRAKDGTYTVTESPEDAKPH